jgi:GNAT superfamily N-acetyltransferase
MLIQLRDLEPAEFDQAVGILARGMRDTPMNVQIFGTDAVRRARAVEQFLRSSLRSCMARGRAICAERGGAVVGVLGVAERRLTVGNVVRAAAPLICRFPPAVTMRIARWFGVWQTHEPRAPHWFLGPLAVETNLQGQGIGSALMQAACSRADERGVTLYCGTEHRVMNARLHQKFGFETTAEVEAMGVRIWFMVRRPRRRRQGST